jgi:hypothetical protein
LILPVSNFFLFDLAFVSIEALESGFWIDRMLAQCRTGEAIAVPPGVNIAWMTGNGFFWYGKAIYWLLLLLFSPFLTMPLTKAIICFSWLMVID